MKYLELNAQVLTHKDGFYQLDKDQEALEIYLKYINNSFMNFPSYNQRMKYLIDNGFYENFYEKYSESQIDEISNLASSYNFKFQSYMSASKFYRDYALKTNDKKVYLEHYQDRVISVSLYLAQGNFNLAKQFVESMMNQYYQPATPTFLNAGRKRRGEMISCFLLDVADSLNSITFNIASSMHLSKIGGGVALNLSRLRSRGESIKGIMNVAKGVVPVAKLLEDSFSYADQMGQRKGAGVAYLNIFHFDIEEFLDTKKINADEKSRIQTLSLGVTIPDKFFELAKNNEDYYVFGPLSVYKEFGIELDDMDLTKMYNDLINNKNILKKKLNAREMLITIAKLQFESGYPYIMFKDNANRENPLKNIGSIRMANLCTEIFQIQHPSLIDDYGKKNQVGHDICCVLGSLNIVNVMEDNSLEFSVNSGIDALTSVSNLSIIENAPSVNKANRDYHSIGLGAMNLHGFFVKNGIDYESEEAKDFVNIFFMTMNYYSIKRSMEIAKQRNETFLDFEKSDYKSGVYFDKYLEKNISPDTEKIKDMFQNHFIPSVEDWKHLKTEVQKYGLYHSYRLAIAPTQSISYVQNSTQSVMPVVDTIEMRTYANSVTCYPMPFLTKDNSHLYKSAYDMDMKNLIDLIAVMQTHVDQGISTTLYVTNQATTRDLVKLYLYAYKKGLKSLYYTRTKNLTIEECIACAV